MEQITLSINVQSNPFREIFKGIICSQYKAYQVSNYQKISIFILQKCSGKLTRVQNDKKLNLSNTDFHFLHRNALLY